jgi:hypothetical protein
MNIGYRVLQSTHRQVSREGCQFFLVGRRALGQEQENRETRRPEGIGIEEPPSRGCRRRRTSRDGDELEPARWTAACGEERTEKRTSCRGHSRRIRGGRPPPALDAPPACWLSCGSGGMRWTPASFFLRCAAAPSSPR